MHYFLFNERGDPFDDVRLRRAVNYAIDRRALAANSGIGGSGRPTDQYIPPGHAGLRGRDDLPARGPGPRHGAKARRHRAASRVCFTRATFPNCTRHGQILRSNLARIGIELDVRQFSDRGVLHTGLEPGRALGHRLLELDLRLRRSGDLDQRPVRGRARTPAAGGGRSRVPAANGRGGAADRRRAPARLRAARPRSRRRRRRRPRRSPPAIATHFLSARMGCQVLHPIYILDLAALCVRDEADEE